MQLLTHNPPKVIIFDVTPVFRILSPWLRPGEPIFNPRRPISRVEQSALHAWLDFYVTDMFGFDVNVCYMDRKAVDIGTLHLDTHDFNHFAKEWLFHEIADLKLLVGSYIFRSTLNATTYCLYV